MSHSIAHPFLVASNPSDPSIALNRLVSCREFLDNIGASIAAAHVEMAIDALTRQFDMDALASDMEVVEETPRFLWC